MSQEATQPAAATAQPDGAVDASSYALIKARLSAHGAELGRRAHALNEARVAAFGGGGMALVATERVRTENNCIPRDLVSVGGHLLVGYQVFLGLRPETRLEDVFSLHRFARAGAGFDVAQVPFSEVPGLFDSPDFQRELKELFTYYREARLLQLRVREGKLLAVFQTGATLRDVKVFRWRLDRQGNPSYEDSRGERDHVYPAQHSFEWQTAGRDRFVTGRHPHVNIEDEVFVETVGGDLTVKVENNTQTGKGVYSEPVDDANQALDDAQYQYARVGGLILLRILPFRETTWRHLVYNTRTRQVVRIDAIGQSCVALPEDQGIVFPGGFYLQTGEHKLFEGPIDGLELKLRIDAPNGEDVLYVFHERVEGRYVLLPYNVIRKEVTNPIPCHGYSRFADGTIAVFRAVSEEPSRIHPLSIWETPFCTPEVHAARPQADTPLARIGNADLVRGISEALTVQRMIDAQVASRRIYEDLIRATVRMQDGFPWLGDPAAQDLAAVLTQVKATAELVIDEFEKVQALERQAAQALAQARAEQDRIVAGLLPDSWDRVEDFMGGLTALRGQRGRLVGLRELRLMDRAAVDALEQEAVARFDALAQATVRFLLGPQALQPLLARIDELEGRIGAVERSSELGPLVEELERVTEGLQVVSEVVSGLEVGDAADHTAILERISEVFGRLNRARGLMQARTTALKTGEQRAEFSAQFRLFGQAVAGALAQVTTPEEADEKKARMLLQLEELEARFGELDELVVELGAQREEVLEAFEARKQTLLDARQRRVDALMTAAGRILQGVARRARSFEDEAALNGWFAADPSVLKLRGIAEELLGLGDTVRADELLSRLKSSRQDALRVLRDRLDLFSDGGRTIRLGKHAFHVHGQPFELTVVPRDGALALHLTGTDFFDPVDDPRFEAARGLWDQPVVSEDPTVYRGETLAVDLLLQAIDGGGGLTIERLQQASLEAGGLESLVRAEAARRYDEAYERGIHDADAARILGALTELWASAGPLRIPEVPRAWALLYWAHQGDREARARVERRARSLGRLARSGAGEGLRQLGDELGAGLQRWIEAGGFQPPCPLPDAHTATIAGRALAEAIAEEPVAFARSAPAQALLDALGTWFDKVAPIGARSGFDDDLRALGDRPGEQLALAWAWIEACARDRAAQGAAMAEPGVLLEAAVAAIVQALRPAWLPEPKVVAGRTEAQATGLLGAHPRVQGGVLRLQLADVLERVGRFVRERMPAWRAFRADLRAWIEVQRRRLRVDELVPKVLTSFVRNRLIDEVYLPVLGDNLAKQLGAAGETKRTDRMGMLLLISPPGYGKTTLMEYLASQLGLVFMKINGPALGHSVTSLDPAQAPNATARLEVERINLALEMGNNVMLYLDDIQHTNPELLQKFISLCDAQRRIEGVWRGQPKTWDLRSKKMCVVMAGNPYTESGEKFRIPDMLANRADTYNLGDILGGREDLFALSYLENALTANPVLAPLAGRPKADLGRLVRMAEGAQVPASELEHPYSGVELEEIKGVLRHLLSVRDVLLKVNAAYILSAGQADAYRTEPPFKLQGSYRNMARLTEKVVAAMNDAERERLLDDHYTGEAQTLTTGAEQNLLKLAALRGVMSPQQQERWAEICGAYQRIQAMDGAEDDPAKLVSGQIGSLGARLDELRRAVVEASKRAQPEPQGLATIAQAIERQGEAGAALRDTLSGLQQGLNGALVQMAERLEQALRAGAEPPEPGAVQAQQMVLKQAAGAVVQRLDALRGAIEQAARASAAPTSPTAAPLDALVAPMEGVRAAILEAAKLSAKALEKDQAAETKDLYKVGGALVQRLDQLRETLTLLGGKLPAPGAAPVAAPVSQAPAVPVSQAPAAPVIPPDLLQPVAEQLQGLRRGLETIRASLEQAAKQRQGSGPAWVRDDATLHEILQRMQAVIETVANRPAAPAAASAPAALAVPADPAQAERMEQLVGQLVERQAQALREIVAPVVKIAAQSLSDNERVRDEVLRLLGRLGGG